MAKVYLDDGLMELIANLQFLAVSEDHFLSLKCFLQFRLFFTSCLDDIHQLSSVLDV